MVDEDARARDEGPLEDKEEAKGPLDIVVAAGGEVGAGELVRLLEPRPSKLELRLGILPQKRDVAPRSNSKHRARNYTDKT